MTCHSTVRKRCPKSQSKKLYVEGERAQVTYEIHSHECNRAVSGLSLSGNRPLLALAVNCGVIPDNAQPLHSSLSSAGYWSHPSLKMKARLGLVHREVNRGNNTRTDSHPALTNPFAIENTIPLQKP